MTGSCRDWKPQSRNQSLCGCAGVRIGCVFIYGRLEHSDFYAVLRTSRPMRVKRLKSQAFTRFSQSDPCHPIPGGGENSRESSKSYEQMRDPSLSFGMTFR